MSPPASNSPQLSTPRSSFACSCRLLSPNHSKIRLLWAVTFLVWGFAGVEWGVGYFSHSLTLLADSGHLLFDSLAIALSLLALRLGKHPFIRQSDRHHQIENLTALANSIGLLLVAGWIAWEAIVHLHAPPAEILTLPMLLTAT